MSILSYVEQSNNQLVNFSSLLNFVEKETENIQLKMLLENIAKLDNQFFKSGEWKKDYTCNGFAKRTIITQFGSITFKRRYYMNKNRSLHDNFYYIDSQLEIPQRKHFTLEALALIFNMSCEVNASYAAKNAIPGVVISKQTVSNYQKNINTLVDNIPNIKETLKKDSENTEIIYIEADEAHCNLQHENSKNDNSDEIKTSKRDKKKVQTKNIINKLILVHTGHKNLNLRLKRKSLANKRYFGGIHMPVSSLVDNVLHYISSTYDLSKVKYIFISGDGARWIKSFGKELTEILCRNHENLRIIQVLDKFHCNKYLSSIFNHQSEILNYINDEIVALTKERFSKITDSFFAFSEKRSISEVAFNDKVEYILNNLELIKNQKHDYYQCHCAMEGQVSHILANRLTSRPRGFSEPALQNLTQMLIHKSNNNYITVDNVKEWIKPVFIYKKTKYNTVLKNFKPIYGSNIKIPILESTHTKMKKYVKSVFF